MSKFEGSQTAKNIKAAFQGESMARNRYTFYEEQARKEGNAEVADMFAKMAKNEMMHARLWFKLMNDGLGESRTNIQEAASGENQEWRFMYPEFAKVAKEEGFDDVAKLFEQVAGIEKDHEMTFLKAFAALRTGQPGDQAQQAPEESVKEKTVHRCMFCGAVFDKRPDVCSVCGAIGSFETGTARA